MTEQTAFAETKRPLPPIDRDVAAVRSALKHALSDFLDPPGVEEALQLWRHRFEGEDSLFLRLTFYCRELARERDLAGSEANLHMSVMQALQRDPPTITSMFDIPRLSPVRGPIEAAATVRSGAAAVPAAPPIERERRAVPRVTVPVASGAHMLESFYRAFEAQVARQLPEGVTPARVRRTLIKHARKLPRAQHHPACLWWSGQVSHLEGDWPAGGHGTLLVKVMYRAMAELLGNELADRCFRQAILRLEADSDPSLHAIRRYL